MVPRTAAGRIRLRAARYGGQAGDIPRRPGSHASAAADQIGPILTQWRRAVAVGLAGARALHAGEGGHLW
jgi:hypothetical protein